MSGVVHVAAGDGGGLRRRLRAAARRPAAAEQSLLAVLLHASVPCAARGTLRRSMKKTSTFCSRALDFVAAGLTTCYRPARRTQSWEWQFSNQLKQSSASCRRHGCHPLGAARATLVRNAHATPRSDAELKGEGKTREDRPPATSSYLPLPPSSPYTSAPGSALSNRLVSARGRRVRRRVTRSAGAVVAEAALLGGSCAARAAAPRVGHACRSDAAVRVAGARGSRREHAGGLRVVRTGGRRLTEPQLSARGRRVRRQQADICPRHASR